MGNTRLSRSLGARRLLQRAMLVPASVVTVCALAACSDSTGLLTPASFENVDRQYGVYAITGSSSGLPAGYQFVSESLVRPQVLATGALNFDVAFDITADGKASVISAKRVVPTPPSAVAPVGFLQLTAIYEQLQQAPVKGYVDDTTAILSVGQSVVVRLTGSGCVYGEPFYAKLTIDSINVAQRRLLVRSLVNRNCGYRSLVAGVPKD